MVKHLPNILSFVRILSVVPVCLLTVYAGSSIKAGGYLALLFIGALSDFLDGYTARKLKLVSEFGKILDPIADKFLILSLYAAFTYLDYLPLWMLLVIFLRESIITLTRLVWLRRGRVVAAEMSGKIKTFLQFAYLIAASIALFMEFSSDSLLLGMLLWSSFLATCYSGAEFFIRNSSVSRLKN